MIFSFYRFGFSKGNDSLNNLKSIIVNHSLCNFHYKTLTATMNMSMIRDAAIMQALLPA